MLIAISMAFLATGLGTATATTSGQQPQGTTTQTASVSASESVVPTVPAEPVRTIYRALPRIKHGEKLSRVERDLRARGFIPVVRQTYGRRNAVVSWGLPKSAKVQSNRELTDRKRKVYAYKEGTSVTITVGNGQLWHTGVATWYSTADNTPSGSRATSSGHPLGSFGGWTFTSLRFPMGTVLLVSSHGVTHKVTCTDRGGLSTIDLYKPASDRFHMDGSSRFRYVVIRRGWARHHKH